MDPREPDEKMSGIPLTRTMSPDMRWVYTLYSGEHNFVHALDTQEGTARCIDLPGGDLSAERLALDGPTLQVGDVATIDLRTFALAKAPRARRHAAAPRPRDARPRAKDDGGVAWPPVALGLVALGAARPARPPAAFASRAEPLEVSLAPPRRRRPQPREGDPLIRYRHLP